MKVRYEALTRDIAESDLRQFRSDPSYKLSFWYSSGGGALAGALIVLIPSISIAAISMSSAESFIAVYLISTILAALGGFILVQFLRPRAEKKLYRLVYFAKENNFSYQAQMNGNTVHQGMIFQHGHSQKHRDVITGKTETSFELGNYFYTTGSGKNQQTHDWGYLAIPLQRRVPNMVLDAKSNNSSLFGFDFSSLPTKFQKDQTLSLEGNFDDYFTLYAPKKYERDALYIFTPDLMALLIDNSAPFDVETVEDKLYIYSLKKFDLHDAAVLEKLFAIIATVGKKTLSQTERYADERVGDKTVNQIAVPGKRLKTSAIGSIIFSIILFAYIIFIFL